MIGTWVLYIPYIKDKLLLTDSQLGIALFCLALGIILILPIVPWITKKLGVGNYTLIGVILFAASFIFPILASNYVALCISLFITGIFSGSTDVAMNALVSEMEKSDNNNFMSVAHGFFSLGGVIGGVIGSILISFALDPVWHMTIMALFIILSNGIFASQFKKITEQNIEHIKSKKSLANLRPLFSLAIIALGIMVCEGAIEHWSNLYLIDIIKVNTLSRAGLGFIVFSSTMTLGRFFGDFISDKIGPSKTVIYGCMVAILGYALILMNSFIIVIIGFGIVGMGLSVIIPEVFRIAGKTEGVSASAGISFVSGIGFIGFLFGPVMLGFIADVSNLRISFIFLLTLVVLTLIISFFRLQKNGT